jgi:hypothetical protein
MNESAISSSKLQGYSLRIVGELFGGNFVLRDRPARTLGE